MEMGASGFCILGWEKCAASSGLSASRRALIEQFIKAGSADMKWVTFSHLFRYLDGLDEHAIGRADSPALEEVGRKSYRAEVANCLVWFVKRAATDLSPAQREKISDLIIQRVSDRSPQSGGHEIPLNCTKKSNADALKENSVATAGVVSSKKVEGTAGATTISNHHSQVNPGQVLPDFGPGKVGLMTKAAPIRQRCEELQPGARAKTAVACAKEMEAVVRTEFRE